MAAASAMRLLPVTERLAGRNALAVFVVFCVLKGLRRLRRGRPRRGQRTPVDEAASSPPAARKQGSWDEALNTTLAAGLTAEVFSRVQTLSGSEVLGGAASILPLRLLCDNRTYHFNYRFLISYISAQVLVSWLPRSRWRDLLIMIASASQLLGWWVLSDTMLPAEYIRFLDREGKVDRDGRDSSGTLMRGSLTEVRRIFRNEDGQQKWKDFQRVVFPRPGRRSLAAQYDSPNSVLGYHKAALHYFVLHFRESMPFYLKIYMVRLLASLVRKGGGPVRRAIADALAGDPALAQHGANLISFATDVARSSCFLALYCTLPWYMCGGLGYIFPNLRTNMYSPVMWLALSAAGCAILVESKAQQTTIANYCATFGVYPLLSAKPVLFDAAGVAVAVACTSGLAKRPALLNLLWPADPAGARARRLASEEARLRLQQQRYGTATAELQKRSSRATAPRARQRAPS
eukprot:TRINITY_DN1749_c0_g5_i1.p1 TRINITY_DN1749_c0_g5~~TRINITY_DN1749_c0_g5_i1.p1  ORF type:complete len:491 (+),score=137.74 TRINITY_DN1749_c0_g5_i1:92-1474(+)